MAAAMGADDAKARAAVLRAQYVDVSEDGSVTVRADLFAAPNWWAWVPRPGSESVYVRSERDLENVRERKLKFPRENMIVLISHALSNGMEAGVEVAGETVVRVVMWPRPLRWWQRFRESLQQSDGGLQ
jgi:hypothetical protein